MTIKGLVKIGHNKYNVKKNFKYDTITCKHITNIIMCYIFITKSCLNTYI